MHREIMLLLGIVGMPGAGKTSVAEYLKSKCFPSVRLGSIVTSEVLRRSLPLTPENERAIREEFRAQHGMDVMAQKSLPDIHALMERSPVVVIDGLYSFAEYKLFNEQFGDSLVLIAVAASRLVRYRRLECRSDRPLSVSQAKERDFREIETLEKGGPIAIADYTLINDGTPAELNAKVDELLRNLRIAEEMDLCKKMQ
jgi:dephospho-CoA kinase